MQLSYSQYDSACAKNVVKLYSIVCAVFHLPHLLYICALFNGFYMQIKLYAKQNTDNVLYA